MRLLVLVGIFIGVCLFGSVFAFQRLEFWAHRHFEVRIDRCPAGCIIVSLGWVGVTWLMAECYTAESSGDGS